MRTVLNIPVQKFQKRFKYNICETEPKLENTTIENYAYGYHNGHVQQLSKVVHLAPIIIMLCMNLVRRMIIYSILFMYLRWYRVSLTVSNYLFSLRKKTLLNMVQ